MKQFACSLCGGVENKPVFSAADFDQATESFELIQCAQCGVTQTRPVPDPVSLDQYYSRSYYGGGSKKFSGIVEALTVLGNRLRAKKILAELRKKQADHGTTRVLDIGCGRANLLLTLKDMGCECFGTERGSYPSDERLEGISIHQQSLQEIGFDDAYFNAVVIWHVLEHLDQPFEALDEISRITGQDGLIAIAVPNFASFQASIFKSNWFHLDLPRHLYHFDPESLDRALLERGYEIHSVNTCSLEQNLFGFVQSLMNALNPGGRPNSFYQLLKQRSGLAETLKLSLWTLLAIIVSPIALLEYIVTCGLNKGASLIIFAHKTRTGT
jgi:SAM-dependent methyltransferase